MKKDQFIRFIKIVIQSIVVVYLVGLIRLYILPIDISFTDLADATGYTALFAPLFAIPIVFFLYIWMWILRIRKIASISLTLIIVLTALISGLWIISYNSDVTFVYSLVAGLSSLAILYIAKKSNVSD